MNIIEAIRDENVFRPFLQDRDGSLTSWKNWMTCLRAAHALPITAQSSIELVRKVTGRDANQLPEEPFSTVLSLTGRRSGKSRIAAVVACWEAILSGKEKRLSPGEQGIVAVVSPTRKQSSLVKSYCHGLFKSSPMLAAQVVEETREGFTLRNGVRIEILTGDFKSVRGFTLLAAVIDEICFFNTSEECRITDVELVRALKPALGTVSGTLWAISSPYSRTGWAHDTYKKHFGNNASSNTLVINGPSQLFNPLLPDKVVQEALAEDLQAAKSEYLGEWRDDVGQWLPREVIERLVVKGRKELAPNPRHRYVAFVDLSGGRNDDSALAIGHRDDRKVIVDYLGCWKPVVNSPYDVVRQIVEVLRRYGISRVTGDNYAAEWVARAFTDHRIVYEKSPKNKSILYGELLPHICSEEIALLDDEKLVNQLASLERRVHQGGKDRIDHSPGGHDDLANCIAGLSDIAGFRGQAVGGFPDTEEEALAMGMW